MLRRLFNRVFVIPWTGADRMPSDVPVGPWNATAKAVFTMIVSSLMLCGMNFLVLDGGLQTRLSDRLVSWVAELPPGSAREYLLAVSPLYRHAFWSLGCTFFYFVVPALIVRLVYRERLRDYGILPRDFFRHLPIYLVLFLPVFVAVVVVSNTEAFQRTYPFYHHPQALWDLWAWEFFYCLQFFALEFFFRGFMVHAMRPRMGVLAVFVMVIPYCMIHFGKPGAEAVGAIIAGSVLGVLSLWTGTIWGGVFIHSAVAITMDWASLIQQGRVPGTGG